MKQIRGKPLVTISTYEERQYELRGVSERDETDKASKAQSNQHIAAKTIYAQLERPSKLTPAPTHPPTPIPDYDDVETCMPLAKPSNGDSSGTMKGTMGRCAAHEIAKASGDAAELESIDSYKLTNPSSPTPKPPSMYFNSQSTGPATLKKPQRPVSVTIGEYTGRKEPPSKFDFIKSDEQQSAVAQIDITNADDNMSDKLKSELEKALSRSNLKSRNDNEIIAANGTTKVQICQQKLQHFKQPPPLPPGYNTNGIISNGKPSLHKTQSNVEKITAMLVSQNLMGSNSQSTTSSENRVTINVANGNKTQLRKTESTPINGILKNGTSASNGHHNGGPSEHKNISFGNITTVVTSEKR